MKIQFLRKFWPLAPLSIILVQLAGLPILAAAPISSGQTECAHLDVSENHTYEFQATTGDRILISAVRTGGHPSFNTEILLLDPASEDEVNTQPGGDHLDHDLLETGQYTIIVQDTDLNNYGDYCVTLQNLSAGPLTSDEDADGGPLGSSEMYSGSHSASDMDAFEFHGQAGDRVIINVEKTGGHPSYDTDILLIDPDKTDEAAGASGQDLIDHILEKTGTYTIIASDVDRNIYGSYNITVLNLTAGPLTNKEDADGGPIVSGDTVGGTQSLSDMDVFQFYGEAGDRAIINVVKTGGHPSYDTEMILIDPDHTNETDTLAGGDRLDHQLLKTGLYTVIVQDTVLNNYGSYNITLLKLPGTVSSTMDCNGEYMGDALLPASFVASDMDLFHFYGQTGDRVIINAVKTGGHPSFDTEVVLIDPDFIDETRTEDGGDQMDHRLSKTGLYYIMVQDVGQNNYGSCNVSLVKFPDIIREGIYAPFPSGACDQPVNPVLTWNPVPGATGYDVYLGNAVQATLERVAENVEASNWPLDELEKGTVYNWKIIAHTPARQIAGPVHWFLTEMMCDLNNDCRCDIHDWPLFTEDWGSTDCDESDETCACDLNQDGACNILDWPDFVKSWGKTSCLSED